MWACHQMELTLHDQKMRIINIQLHWMEQIGHLSGRTIPSIDQIFTFPPYQHLPCYIHLLALLVSHRTGALVLVVKYDRYGGFVYACLALFINQFGEVAGANLWEVLNAKDEADRVKDVGFARAIKAGDGIEVRVESDRGKTIDREYNISTIKSSWITWYHPDQLTRRSPYDERTIWTRQLQFLWCAW